MLRLAWSPKIVFFANYTKLKSPINFTCSNSTEISAIGVGDIICYSKVANKIYELRLANVFHVPNLAENILCINDFLITDHTAVFSKDKCEILNKEMEPIIVSKRTNNLFYAELQVPNAKNAHCYNCRSVESNSANTAEIWHNRLIHCGVNKMHEAISSNQLTSINVQLKDLKDFDKCTTCLKSKSKKSPFKTNLYRSENLLDLIHSDVCQAPTESFSGFKYFVNFIDDHSGYLVTFPIKNKSDVFHKFIIFKNFVENQTGRTIKELRTDGGGEYCNHNFKNFLQEHGIIHNIICPYNPQSNGKAERMNQSILTGIRSTLIKAGLTQKLWAESLMTVAYILNRLPKTGQNLTPHEIFFKRKPSAKHLKTFGCLCYAHIDKPNAANKLDARSKLCIFLGYNRPASGYRLMEIGSNNIIDARNVTFLEDKFICNISSNNCDYLRANTHNTNDFPQSVVKDEVKNRKRNNSKGEDHLSQIEEAVPLSNRFETLINLDESELSDTEENENEIQVAEENVHEQDINLPLLTQEELENARGRCSRYGRTYKRVHRYPDPDPRVHRVNRRANEDEKIPSVEEALADRNWSNAMNQEMQSITDHKVWTLVKRPKDRRILTNRWVFKKKLNENSEVTSYKARLVVKGFNQKHGEDYDSTFSPVVSFDSVRILLAHSAENNCKIHHVDVSTAFLNGDLDEPVFMEQPIGFENLNYPNYVCKLEKSLYGLRQAPRAWNYCLNNYLEKLGFIRCEFDNCLYKYSNGQNTVYLAVYVDDILISSNCEKLIDEIKSKLSRNFKIKDLGILKYFLGININQDKNSIRLNQSTYIANLLEKLSMSNCKPHYTPFTDDFLKDDPQNLKPCNVTEFQSAIGSLLYLSTKSRPDIAFAVNYVARKSHNPNVSDFYKVLRIIRYLKTTINFGIVYHKNIQKPTHFAYSDASFADCIQTRKSTSGFVFCINNSPVTWRSSKQSIIALSTTEAELISIADSIKEITFVKLLLEFFDRTEPVVLFEDNQSTIKICLNEKISRQSKHYIVRILYVRQEISNNNIILKYCPTEEMPADMFTKNLGRIKFHRLCNLLNLVDHSENL